MDAELLSLLRCVLCGSPLTAADGLHCVRGHEVRVDSGGWIDLWAGTTDRDLERTVESFGFEWTTFDRIMGGVADRRDVVLLRCGARLAR